MISVLLRIESFDKSRAGVILLEEDCFSYETVFPRMYKNMLPAVLNSNKMLSLRTLLMTAGSL